MSRWQTILDQIKQVRNNEEEEERPPIFWIWVAGFVSFLSGITGRLLGRPAERELADLDIAIGEERVLRLCEMLIADEITLGTWQEQMRAEIRMSIIEQYLLGRGGREQLTQVEYGSMGGMIRKQYRYLDRFARQIRAGEVSPAQLRMRAPMYIRSAREAFERARARAYGIPRLPAYPRDGSTRCKSNCGCGWRIVEVERGWNCFWTLGLYRPVTEHCEDCLEYAARWNPLFVRA